MELLREDRDGVAVVSLPVPLEIDLARADEFRAALERTIGDAPTAVLDAARCEFFDSAGMGVLLSVHRTLRSRGGGLVLAGPTRMVREVFDMVGFDTIFHIHEDVAQAVAACRESA